MTETHWSGCQCGVVEGKLTYVDHVHELPERNSLNNTDAVAFLTELASYQHPDHGNNRWPPP